MGQLLWGYQKTLSHTSKRGSGEGWEARTCNAFKRTFTAVRAALKIMSQTLHLCRRDALFQFVENYIHEHIGSNCLCYDDVCALSCKCGYCSEKNCFFHSLRLSKWIVSTCFDCELNTLPTSNLVTHTSYHLSRKCNPLNKLFLGYGFQSLWDSAGIFCLLNNATSSSTAIPMSFVACGFLCLLYPDSSNYWDSFVWHEFSYCIFY